MEDVYLYNIVPPLQVSKDVALVGNSELLLNSEYGDEIDKHDTIIRFNLADLNEKIKKHTGIKTSIRWINGPVDIYSAKEHNNGIKTNNGFSKYIKKLCKNVKIIAWNSLIERVKNIERNIITFSPNGICTCKNVNLVLKELGIQTRLDEIKDCWPRTGLTAILTCIKSGTKPYLYGFETQKRDIIRHYSQNSKYDITKIRCHQVNREIDILNELEEKDLIIIRRGKSTIEVPDNN
jgi:hypothetical protein